MRKIKCFPLLLILMLLVLSACSGTSAATEADTGNGATDSIDAISGTPAADRISGAGFEMDEVSQLIFGSLLLDETENAITAEQAQAMLPLWQLYQTMASEDTTAPEELNAIIQQISRLFAEEQLSAIAEMDFSNPMEMMADLDLGSLPGTMEGDVVMERPEGVEGLPEGFEGGNPGGGGQVWSEGPVIVGSSEDFDPELLSTLQAERQGGSGNMQTMIFIPAVIEYLEGLIAG